ncbi:MAG: hypothetical protein Q9195_003617 [Heterodermia aff. obscurata]
MAGIEKLPVLGVLTRTLVKSPVIKFIIPARIRDPSPKNDVIFVYNDSVEIKEVIIKDTKDKRAESVYLKDIVDKADFDSSIRSARILGRTRQYETVKDYQDIPSRPMKIPPQILALTLESSKVVFLCAFYDWGNHLRWLSSYRILPNHAQSYSKQLGEHIAVDPKSRAMAVAAIEGSFVLYALMPMDRLKEQVETVVGMQSSKFNPVMDERFFHVDGVILKMEFLHPSKTDIDEVILLVIVAKKQKTKLHCYVWDYRTGLRQASELGSGQRVLDDERLPLLLIPLRMSTAFMIVTQRHVTVYTGILTGPATWQKHPLRHYEAPEQPGSSRSLPIFTQWARVLRYDDHVSVQDNIYLCREDGVVYFLEIGDSSSRTIDSGLAAGQLNFNMVGRLRVNISTAFATLHLGGEYHDLLVVGGDLSAGGLFFFAPREKAELMSTIPNWTPMIDIAVTKVKQPNVSSLARNDPVKDQMRIFAGTGRGPIHGEITEIRYGVEGAINGEIEPVENAVTDIWALYDPSSKCVHIVVSSPTDTALLPIESDEGELPDTDSQVELVGEAQTIAAGLTMEGGIVQITATAIVVTSSADRRRRLAVEMKDESVTCASIMTSNIYGCVLLTTMKRETGNYLQCTRICTDSEEIGLQPLGDPVDLPTEPSCSLLQEIQGRICAFVGLLTGSLLVFGRSNGVGPCLQVTFKHEFEGDFAVCDSIATIVDESQGWLVCGLRNGSCQTLGLASEGRMLLTPFELFVLGNTSVNVKSDEEHQNRAILACDDIFCTLEYSYEHPRLATIRKILLTNEEKPGYKQGSIKAFTQVSFRQSDRNIGSAAGQWFCMEGENFNRFELRGGSQSSMIPRRMYLDGTPTRISFSEKLDRLIVLYTRIVIKRDPNHGQPGRRVVEPTFAFLDIDKGLLRPDPDNHDANNELRVVLSNNQHQRANVLTVQERKPGEKYLGMTEWFPTDGENVYHMLIVFTMIVYDDERAETGRLLFFSLSQNVDGQVSMASKKITELKAPVFAVVPYGQSSLIYSCGEEVFLHTLKLTSKPREWLSPVVLTLQSRGVHFSISGQFVHITTATDSLSVLRVGEGNRTLTLEYSDEVARDGIFHLDLPAQGLIITSSKDGTITGLRRPPRKRISNSMPTAFIAEFAGSITRLRRMSRPSWQLNESSKASRLSPESIIACTADGTLYQIDILEESTWRFLRFISNMARRHHLICPYREKFRAMVDARHARHIEPRTSNKRFMQVDGDILIRLLDRGGEQLLNDMVNHEPYGEDAVVDFDTAAARSQRFWELAKQAGVDVPEFRAVVSWMRGMLVSVI